MNNEKINEKLLVIFVFFCIFTPHSGVGVGPMPFMSRN